MIDLLVERAPRTVRRGWTWGRGGAAVTHGHACIGQNGTNLSQLAADAPRAAQAAGEDNELVVAGWELLTPDAVPFSRYTDTDADPAVRYVYAVEAIDASGNLSALALGDTEPGDNER